MKKILFLHVNLDVGGAEMMRLVLLRNIDRNRYNIKICCIGKKGAIGREIEKLGYHIDELNQNPCSLSPAVTYRLIKYIRNEHPDILHSSLFNANFHSRIAGLACRVPHLITEEHGEHAQYKGIKFFPYIASDWLLSMATKAVICCSEKLREDIVRKEGLFMAKVLVVENCIDKDMYAITEERQEIRRKYNISGEMVFMLTATLKAGKGHEELMEAFREAKAMGYRFKCLFAGNGPLKDMLFKRCSELGLSEDIVFLGAVDNITDYLNVSDVFVLPSVSEGLSIALLEAMQAGLACIVTDVGANSDLVKDGFNGMVIPPNNRPALKDAIVRCFKDRNLIREFGQKSAAIAEKYSNKDKYIKGFYDIWDKCI